MDVGRGLFRQNFDEIVFGLKKMKNGKESQVIF
jgi:hypothetical protein